MYRAISLYLLVFINFNECCDCNLPKKTKDLEEESNNLKLDKRQSQDGDYDRDIMEFIENEDTIKTGGKSKDNVLQETHFELNETEFSVNVEADYLKQICPHYKSLPDLDMDKMVDVWEMMYYRTAVKLMCFKMQIKRLTNRARLYYEDKYGDFNETINWGLCELQLTASGVKASGHQHFFQGLKNESGILENIILQEEVDENVTTIILNENNPDQWMVLDNLLLMRDCENGDLVIFARIPYRPTLDEVNQAMEAFGEAPGRTTWECEKLDEGFDHLRNPRYHIIS